MILMSNVKHFKQKANDLQVKNCFNYLFISDKFDAML